MKPITETDFYRHNELVITKLEELESFHVLKTILVPLFVESWNKTLRRGPEKITNEDVLKKLKKTRRDPDEIVYTYTSSLKRELYFYIEKHLRYRQEKEYPAIRIGYYDSNIAGVKFHYIEDIRDKKINELREEVSRPDMSMSKLEEHEALDFLKRKVVEKMVNLFNHYVDQKNNPSQRDITIPSEKIIKKHITNKDIISRLRKTFHEKKGESKKSQFSDYIEYTSTIYGINFVFFIQKHAKLVDDGYRDIIIVGFIRPYSNENDFLSKISYAMSDWNDVMEVLNEEVADQKKYDEYQKKQAILGHIDKFEEHRSLDFIRKVVIPKLVQHYNSRTEDTPSVFNNYNPPKPVNVADVNRNLKKSKHLMFGGKDPDTYFSDYIEYTSKVDNNIFTFYIDKMYDQTHGVPTDKRRIVLGCGFEDPFVLQKWSYQVGERYL